ncbi:MAG: sugar phosphate isomerase/epimerase [Phycisphaerales bacterium]|nr:MAG: sugar phosphate isomerase/epimerase [Phycisphaerales bacterium]
MNRREMLLSMAGGLVSASLGDGAAVAGVARVKKKRLGIADFSYNIRLRAERAGGVKGGLGEPLTLLEHCHSIGGGGVQMNIGIRDELYTRKLRERAQRHQMFIEGSTSLPKGQSDVERFDAAIRTARDCGAEVVRLAIGGRRYEQFNEIGEFRVFAERALRGLQLAEPVARRHRIRLAIENHKDWRIGQMLDMLKRLGSEYVGVCVDTGNSIALLEEPMSVVEAYAPCAFSAHLKDLEVAEYDEGFLLADVVLGQGRLDLPKMVDVLRKANPDIRFSLEMATRDPLKVPCLMEKYWATFEDVPGADLARILRYVRARPGEEAILPEVSHLPLGEQVKLEQENVKRCLRYASEHLNL